jgi:hypothetical protein
MIARHALDSRDTDIVRRGLKVIGALALVDAMSKADKLVRDPDSKIAADARACASCCDNVSNCEQPSRRTLSAAVGGWPNRTPRRRDTAIMPVLSAMQNSDAGYSITEPMFERREMDHVCQAIVSADLPRTKAGVRHVLRIPAVRGLAAHPNLMTLAARFIGEQPIPFRATLFDKSAASNWLVAWYQDTALPMDRRVDDAAWGPWSVKGGVLHAIAPASALATIVALRVHLDDSTLANGPLRVLPGSHAGGVLTHDQIQDMAAGVTPVACVAAAGSIVAMRPLVVHASSKARDDQPRRVLHIEYAASVHFGHGFALAGEPQLSCQG